MSLRLVKYFRSPSAILSDWTSLNPTLAKGEISYLLTSDGSTALSAKVGPGVWDTLPYLGKNLVDKLHTLNKLGAAASASGVGFEIEENNAITGYFKTNSTRNGYDIKSPAVTSQAQFLMSSLTSNRIYTFPNATGVIALTSAQLTQFNVPYVGADGVLTEDSGFSYNPTTNLISTNGYTVALGTGTVDTVPKWTTPNVIGNSTITNTSTLTTILAFSASVNTIQNVLKVSRGVTGTPGVGVGGSIEIESKTNTGPTPVTLSKLESVSTSITPSAEVGLTRLLSKTSSGAFVGIQVLGEFGNTTLRSYSSAGAVDFVIDGQSNSIYINNVDSGTIDVRSESTITILSDNTTSATDITIFDNVEINSGLTNSINLTTNTNNAPVNPLKLKSIGISPAIGTGTGIEFETFTGSLNYEIGGLIQTVSTDITLGSEDFDMVFKTMTAGAAANEKFRIQSDGYLKLATQPANDNALTEILVRDSTGLIKYRSASSIGAAGNGHVIYNAADVSPLTQRANMRVTNGLTASDSTPDTLVKLGGALTEATTISGAYNVNLDSQNLAIFSSTPNYNSGTKIVFLGYSSTRPTAAPTSGVYMWAEEDYNIIPGSGPYRLMVMDGYGNITGL